MSAAARSRGFTLIELAIVMVILGTLAGGGISLLRVLSERSARMDTAAALERAHGALVTSVALTGRLPFADVDGDGEEDDGETVGALPTVTLAIPPHDPFSRPMRYEAHALLTADRQASCQALAASLTGRPQLMEAGTDGGAFTVAAVLVSAGPTDADGDGDVLDDLSGAAGGDNRDGSPNYVRSPPVEGFDDVVRYVTTADVFAAATCLDALRTYEVQVTNASASAVYLHDATLGTCLGQVGAGADGAFRIIRGDSAELRDGPTYATSAPVTSSPAGPAPVSGDLILTSP